MIITRLLSLIFRFSEFVAAAVVMGITAWFLHVHHKQGSGPLVREIFVEVWAVLSLLVSLVWLLPFTASIMHYPVDLILSLGWFAAFALLVNWVHKINCGSAFHWGGITHGGQCGNWKADEAFAFISACIWLASALLSMYVHHKVAKRDPVATDGGRRRRRFV